MRYLVVLPVGFFLGRWAYERVMLRAHRRVMRSLSYGATDGI
jgi:hypothetical protein